MKEITVFLSTYNGEDYILQQLESLEKQKKVKINLFIRDDGSKDNTIELINGFKFKNINVRFVHGKNIGVRNSFMWLINNCPFITEYYALCDQDDFWKSEKLIAAINYLEKDNINIPKLYYSNVTVTDENLNIIGKSNYDSVNDRIPVGFVNNPATGCTIVFNKLLFDNLKFPSEYTIRMHDWWIYKTCLAINGKIYRDSNSHIYYRQHANNVIGATKKQNKIKKIYNFSKKISYFSSETKELEKIYSSKMRKDDIVKLEKVINLPYLNFFERIKILFDNDFNIGILKYTIQLKLAILIYKDKGGKNGK